MLDTEISEVLRWAGEQLVDEVMLEIETSGDVITPGKVAEEIKKRMSPNNMKNTSEIVRIKIAEIRESGINPKIYHPISEDRLIKLANDIKRNGLLEPLLLSSDGVVISGHTRLKALQHLGRTYTNVRYHPISSDNPDFEKLLVSSNDQRQKNTRERNNELKVQIDPLEYRRKAALNGNVLDSELEPVAGSLKASRGISDDRAHMVNHIMGVLKKNEEYLPITLRSLHYQLLNNPPIISMRSKERYGNNLKSYQLLSKIATSMRVKGIFHYSAIADPTRRLDSNRGYENVDHYKKSELDNLYSTYSRDLLRSQEHYFALIAEKETMSHLVDRVARMYGMPVLYCKGGSSITLRYRLIEDWRRNGSKPMVLFFLTDLDPAGLRIQNSFVGSLQYDFEAHPQAFRICITQEQIRKYKLVSDMSAKETDPNFKQFVETTGITKAYELEALPPDVLIREVDEVIKGAIDTELFNEELTVYNKEIEILEHEKARILDLL